MKIVKIEWVDSGGNDVMWEFKDSLKLDLLECTSVGFLIKKDSKSVTIAQSDSQNQYGRPFVIPRGCIKSIKELKD